MKNLIYLLIALQINIALYAQSPQKMNYQAVIHDSNNQLITNKQVSIRISILKWTSTGESIYTETQTLTTNNNGLVSLEIGGGSVVFGSFSVINWANGPYYIKTEIDPMGGNNYSIQGTSQLLSVPYAFFADKTGDKNFHYIGELYGGGIIYWLDESKQHGLIVALDDLGPCKWYNIDLYEWSPKFNAIRDGIYGGKENTTKVMTVNGNDNESINNTATWLCANYNGKGYGDWYLPSLYELKLIDRNFINGSISSAGGTPILHNNYWSSTEKDNWYVWCYDILNNYETPIPRNYGPDLIPIYVRAIRAF